MLKQTVYTVGGTVQAGGGVYIKRQVDDELLDLCRRGKLAFILSSRQVGKSSLMVRTAQELTKENIRSVTIDLSAIGVNVSSEEWYLGILNEIRSTLELRTNIFTWWSEFDQLGPAQRLTNFFKDVLLKEVQEPIVLFFDEIDSTLSIPFSDDFYVALRAVYNARSTTPDFKRLSFVLVGVAAPSDLISDSKRTPFNIGHRVEINDFTLAEAHPLANGLGEQAFQVLEWVFQFTGGHPYLTQLLCSNLANSKQTLDAQAVANQVEQLFMGEQGKQDNNLQFVRDMLSSRSPDVRKVLKIYRDIRANKKVRDDERSITKAHLKLSGLVRSENGLLKVRNEIYNRVFNLQWIHENTPKNWARVTTIAFGGLTFVLLFIFVYDLIVGNMSSQYVDRFYASESALEKLENLAKMFELQGILQNTDYDYRARELFYSLNWDEQTSLFTAPYISLAEKQKYLPTVVKGLYLTLANVDGGQDSTELLRIMENALADLDTASDLRNEIGLWLDARMARKDQDAFDKYSEAIQLNPDNPAIRYERAKVAIGLGRYEQGLLDLESTMRLAQNVAAEISDETPISTQFSRLTPQLHTPGLTLTASVTPDPANDSTGAGGSRDSISTPAASPTVAGIDSYQSRFYSFATIRSAVDLLIQRNLVNPDFQNFVILARGELDRYANLNNGLLPEKELITDTPPSRTTEPTTPINRAEVLLEDDFSSVQWGNATDADSSVEYSDETLRMIVFTKNWFVWSTPNSDEYQDVHMEVTVINNNTDPNTAFGLMCNKNGDDSFYYFAVTPAGQYTIAKTIPGQSDLFLTNDNQWATSDLITQNASSYRIGADCGNDTLTLYVGDQEIDSVSDSAYTRGEVALFTWSAEDGQINNVSFDDFLMTSLP